MPKLPEIEKSLWREDYPDAVQPLYPALTSDLSVDVAVIGAGITGLTAAYLLKRSGLDVAVLEKHTVGGGTTGRTTGKVTSQHELIYLSLLRQLGKDAARAYGEANQAAVELVETNIQSEDIDCDWRRDDNYVFTEDPAKVALFQQEAQLAASLGLPASFETTTPLPFLVQAAVKFSHQGKFNAQKYVLGLARAVNGQGSHVFERSTVIGIRDGEPGRVRTRRAAVKAKSIIVASSVPTLPLIARAGYGLLEYPSETYAVAGRLDQPFHGMYISPDRDHYSVLPVETNGEHILLIVGEGHFWGLRGSRSRRFQRLAGYAEKHFGITTITNRWSDRDYLAYDNVPLVGKLYPWSKHLYVGTGFKKWGLSNGTVAGMILHDLILARKNRWMPVFNSSRLTPVKAIRR